MARAIGVCGDARAHELLRVHQIRAAGEEKGIDSALLQLFVFVSAQWHLLPRFVSLFAVLTMTERI